MKKIIPAFFVIVCLMASCVKPDQYPEVPTLEYKSLEFSIDTSGTTFPTFTLTATFTDGDGDVGYNSDDFPDPASPYNSNFVITLLCFKNGVWTDTIKWCRGINLDTVGVYSMPTRLPYLTPTGKNKGLKGEIFKTEDLPACLKDTIKISAFIYDRALHKSNVIETPAYFIDIQ